MARPTVNRRIYMTALAALRYNLNQLEHKETHWRQLASREQVGKVIILMRELMIDKDNRDTRINTLRNLLNIPVNSTNDLLKWEAHCLIEFMEDEKVNRDLIVGAELNM